MHSFLMQVVEKHTLKPVFDAEEFTTDTDDLHYAKHRYLKQIERLLCENQETTDYLSNVDWCIDGVFIE